MSKMDLKPVLAWLGKKMQGNLVETTNRFSSISLLNKGRNTEVNPIPESLKTSLIQDFDNFRLNEKQLREDLILEWVKDHLSNVSEINHFSYSIYDEFRVRMALSFSDFYHGDEKRDFQLVLGDLSGIQNYLFSISHIGKGGGGIAKRLRARSLHLSLLTKTATFYIADSFGLSYRHILMNAGGVFLMILPPEVKIDTVRDEMNKYLYDRYHGFLSLHLVTYKIGTNQISSISHILYKMHGEILKFKSSPFLDLLQTKEGWKEEAWVFDMNVQEYCESCHRHPVSYTVSEMNMCEYCALDQLMGKQLPKSNYAVYLTVDQDSNPKSVFWSKYKVLLSEEWEQVSRRDEKREIVCIEQWVGNVTSNPEVSNSNWVQTVAVSNYVPEENGAILDFDSLAKKSRGKPLLGVYKADVDHLGMLLSYGLKGERGDYSLMEYLSVSRRLDQFFAEKLVRELPVAYPWLYTVFSGGDDLFLIGPWSDIPEFSLWLNQEFKRFTNNNPEITISASVVIVSPKTPLAVMAEMAEEGLDEAKEGVCSTRRLKNLLEGRNQVYVNGVIMEWKDLEQIWNLVMKWDEWVSVGAASQGFIRSLVQLANLYLSYLFDGKIEGLKYLSFLTYAMNRLPTVKGAEVQQGELIKWIKGLRKSPSMEADREWILIPSAYELYKLYKERS